MNAQRVSHFREFGGQRAAEFHSKGYERRYFFPHRTYYLPKCGPDGFKLANWMCGRCELDQLWEVVIYADGSILEEFPSDLFFDDDLVWHQQQFGKTGQIATANLVIAENSLYSMVHVSDLVQRISRRKELKTRIENRFKGWNHMLFNSVLNFALEKGLSKVRSPTSELALRNTDPARQVGKELFERVYDRNVQQLFRVSRDNGWWVIDVNENRERVVIPTAGHELISDGKIICLCHDIEMGFGHTQVDLTFARFAHGTSAKGLQEMLTIEREMNVKGTYNVLGMILPAVRKEIEMNGHCIAFHSYDHRIVKDETLKDRLLKFLRLSQLGRGGVDRNGLGQLDKCREVDYRIKGYRPAQSKITPELTDDKLAFHNFEWLASSAYYLGITSPMLSHRIVKIPILFDDFDMHMRKLNYEDWESMVIENLKENDFVAFSLHDCYSHLWLGQYRRLLEKIIALGKLKTLDEVASEVIMSNAK